MTLNPELPWSISLCSDSLARAGNPRRSSFPCCRSRAFRGSATPSPGMTSFSMHGVSSGQSKDSLRRLPAEAVSQSSRSGYVGYSTCLVKMYCTCLHLW